VVKKKERNYLSAVEAAALVGRPVKTLHRWVKDGKLVSTMAASGQQRFRLSDLAPWIMPEKKLRASRVDLNAGTAALRIYHGDAAKMIEKSGSVHLIVTSPPYFNAKMYGRGRRGDLGDYHDLDAWFERITLVWAECFRVLAPGRKMFINIMNLPVRENGSFRSLNLTGRTVDVCDRIGFVFKRDIVWEKTNGVRAHFGTYPYPGGILLNHMHEFILEFQKPAPKGTIKYAHVSRRQKEASKLDREFWLSLKNSDVWLMKPEASGDNRSHVAPFPYILPWRIIKAYSFIGETVLDPFAGSGTTLKAARDLSRKSIGYEINEKIFTKMVEILKAQTF